MTDAERLQELRVTLDRFMRDNSAMESALEFYADEHTYSSPTPDGHSIVPHIEMDRGKRARDTLTQVRGISEIKSAQMQQQPFRTAKDALTYWMAQYQLAYGTEYKPSNWGRETYQLKILLERHGAVLLKHIIDVVMRLYPTRWTSQRFPRPTIGALVSWLAAQAEPFARANMDVPATEVTVTDDTDVVAEYESKGWL